MIEDGQEKILAEVGKEFGATTGRPRKCGWLDLDEVNKAIKENGVSHLCLVKTDVMTHIDNPYLFISGSKFRTPRINDVNTSDLGFVELLNTIKLHTGIKQISYTTGPKRGEIVWY